MMRGRRCRHRKSEKRSVSDEWCDDSQAPGPVVAAGVMAADEDAVFAPSAAVAEPDGLSLLWQMRPRARLSLRAAARCSGAGSPRSLLAILCTLSSSRNCSWRISSSAASPLHRRR